MREEILRLENITYVNNGMETLNQFDLQVFEGEIIGLLYINNIGKKELIDILIEGKKFDYGKIYINEKLVKTYAEGNKIIKSICFLDRKNRLVKELSALENIYILNNISKAIIFNEKNLLMQYKFLVNELEIDINYKKKGKNLNNIERIIIEILKAYTSGKKIVLIKDLENFTSDLEFDAIKKILRYFNKKGISFILLSNYYEKLKKISNRIYLNKNGKIIKMLRKESYEIIKEYLTFENNELKNKENCIIIQDLDNKNIEKIQQIVLEQKNNEILNEIKRLLKIKNNEKLNLKNRKLALVIENPTENMIYKNLSVMENLLINTDKRFKHLWMNKNIYNGVKNELENKIEFLFEKSISEQSIKNLYSIIYYRILFQRPELVILINPFSDTDIYIRKHIAKLIKNLTQKNIKICILVLNISNVVEFKLSSKYYTIKNGNIKNTPQNIKNTPFY